MALNLDQPILLLAQLSSACCGATGRGVGSTLATEVASWQAVETARFEEFDEGGPPVASTLIKMSRSVSCVDLDIG